MLLAAIVASQLSMGPSPRAAGDSARAACIDMAASAVSGPAVADLTAALVAHGGAVRWTAERPLAVWVQARPADRLSARHASAEWRGAVAEAIASWNGIVADLRLVVARDSAAADVRVVWAPTLVTSPDDPAAGALASLTAGRTTLVPDAEGRASSALVVLAATAPTGAPYLPNDVRAVARHELGHALGLAHHAAPSSVMAPMVVTERLTDGDRATLRGLYALPIGARCSRPEPASP